MEFKFKVTVLLGKEKIKGEAMETLEAEGFKDIRFVSFENDNDQTIVRFEALCPYYGEKVLEWKFYESPIGSGDVFGECTHSLSLSHPRLTHEWNQ